MFKRMFDVTVALTGLIITLPITLAVAMFVLWTMGRPILFRQERPGLHGKPFTMMKFRTMTDERNASGVLLEDAARLTRLGRFLRSTSLDELPELVNVLRGEMSLVGPRPLLIQYLDRYTPVQARRHEVKPGITGWAQVNGRQDIPFSQRIEYDVWYVDHASIWLDLKILLMTASQVFRQSGIVLGQDVADVDDLGLYSSKKGPSEE